MEYKVLIKNQTFSRVEYRKEEDLTKLFSKTYRNIISEKSFFIEISRQAKSKNFKNFKHSISDGYLLVWDNPTTPSLYITEIELGKHDVSRHILPQLGNFIAFIQSASREELNRLSKFLYSEIEKNKQIFERLRKDTGTEVFKLLDNSMEDLQILLVIDRISPELSIGLSDIEKAIRVKIRKIEISLFTQNKEEVVLFSDSEITEEKAPEEFTLEYHLENKPEKISSIFNAFLKHFKTKTKEIKEYPTKHYIGFLKDNKMIFACVVRKNSLVYYSKARINEINPRKFGLPFRDVRKIGHYTNHLPTEIVITEKNQVEHLISYFEKVLKKY